MSRTVRPASPADAGSLAAIDVNVNINPWNARQFAAACSDANAKEQFAMVVEEDGRTDGFLVFSQVLDEASIYSIGVHSAQQGKGLGHLLLQAALLHLVLNRHRYQTQEVKTHLEAYLALCHQ